MSLKNQVVYIQFHPVAYTVKLNIELSMASLITKLARNSIADRNNEFNNRSHVTTQPQHTAISMKSGIHTSAVGKSRKASQDMDADFQGIRTFKEVDIRIDHIPEEYQKNGSLSDLDDSFDRRKQDQMRGSDDELPLAPPDVPKKCQSWK
jgi:hypothetical protein